MGAIGDAIGAYAQALIDQTDGSKEQLNHALATSQLCWNLALIPDDKRDEAIANIQLETKLNNEHFIDFRDGVILPMIERHKEMFPQMHFSRENETYNSDINPITPIKQSTITKAQNIGRNDPCSCNSGRKYKQCCGK